jgi:hypothetical protein
MYQGIATLRKSFTTIRVSRLDRYSSGLLSPLIPGRRKLDTPSFTGKQIFGFVSKITTFHTIVSA